MNNGLNNATETDTDTAARYWNAPAPRPARTRWWESPAIVRHINRRIAGVASDGTAGGDLALLRAQSGGAPFERAISVGCGSGYHEMQLLQAGVVGHFDLYEIAASRVAAIHARAAAMGLTARIRVSSDDALACRSPPSVASYVFWNTCKRAGSA